MKLIFLLLISLSAHLLYSQADTTILYLDGSEKITEPDKATRYALVHKEKDRWKRIVFDILDDKPIYGSYFSDAACTIQDGPYTAYNKEQRPITIGRYENNKKEGTWKTFSDDGTLTDSTVYNKGNIQGLALRWYTDRRIRDSLFFEGDGNGRARGFWPDGTPREQGSFKAGRKEGPWVYYHKNGFKCQEVQYLGDSAVSYTCYDNKGNPQTTNCIYEKEATFKGGDKAWMKYLIAKLSAARLPEKYTTGRVHGVIYIQFIVDSDGEITDVKALNSIDPDLDRIAITAIKQSPKWQPAVQYNRNVKAYRKQPITFPKVE